MGTINIFTQGGLEVELFFMISGFLMANSVIIVASLIDSCFIKSFIMSKVNLW